MVPLNAVGLVRSKVPDAALLKVTPLEIVVAFASSCRVEPAAICSARVLLIAPWRSRVPAPAMIVPVPDRVVDAATVLVPAKVNLLPLTMLMAPLLIFSDALMVRLPAVLISSVWLALLIAIAFPVVAVPEISSVVPANVESIAKV